MNISYKPIKCFECKPLVKPKGEKRIIKMHEMEIPELISATQIILYRQATLAPLSKIYCTWKQTNFDRLTSDIIMTIGITSTGNKVKTADANGNLLHGT